jgi:hypothetical protein
MNDDPKPAENEALTEVDAVVASCNSLAMTEQVHAALIRDLTPVAERLEGYVAAAAQFRVCNKAQADNAAAICAAIADDTKLVETNEVLTTSIKALHETHRKATGLRERFLFPLKQARKTLKDKIGAWQDAEQARADELARKLKAEAEARAARERAKQEAEAQRQRDIEAEARRKAEDARRAAAEASEKDRARLEAEANAADRRAAAAAVKAEAKQEAADSVVAAQTFVEAPKAKGVSFRRVWKVLEIDKAEFFAELAKDKRLWDFVEIKTAALEREKAAHPTTEIPGVAFDQVTR